MMPKEISFSMLWHDDHDDDLSETSLKSLMYFHQGKHNKAGKATWVVLEGYKLYSSKKLGK